MLALRAGLDSFSRYACRAAVESLCTRRSECCNSIAPAGAHDYDECIGSAMRSDACELFNRRCGRE